MGAVSEHHRREDGAHFAVQRHASLLWGVGLATIVEVFALHLWLRPSHPLVAWSLVLLSILSLAWMVADHRATGVRPVILTDYSLWLRAGLRLDAQVPLAAVEAVTAVSWGNAPQQAADYLRASGPEGPNVLLTFRDPQAVRGVLGMRRRIRRVGLRLEEPGRFIAAVKAARDMAAR